MNEVAKEFQQVWEEFKNTVLQKVPLPRKCDDPVAIVKYSGNAGIFKLAKDQIDTLMLLDVIHKLIENRIEGIDDTVPTFLDRDGVRILRQIITLI